MKILFICHANLCRSFMAQEILKKCLPQFVVFSRGMYVDPTLPVPQKITDFLTRIGLPPAQHQPTQLVEEDLQQADFVFCMETLHHARLLDRFAQYTDKIWLLNEFAWNKKTSIEDPIGLTGRAFDKQARELVKTVEATALRLTKEFPQRI